MNLNNKTRIFIYAAIIVPLLLLAGDCLAQEIPLGSIYSKLNIPAPEMGSADYRQVGNVSSRSIVWFLAQMHLFLAAFVLAVPLFVIVIEWLGVKTSDQRYDDMAHEFMKISMSAYSLTALFGGTLTLALFLLYPTLMNYLMSVFNQQMLVYALLFLMESVLLYMYYYSWYALRYGNKKYLHLSIGVLLNLVGTTLLVVANSWATFMIAPSGVNEVGTVSGNIWEIMRGPLWNPVNLHRFVANVAFGGAIVGAYAAYKFLSSRTMRERAHYDWMGYTANFIAILAFLPLPFAGYWLTAEIYAYSQQMGITIMGGVLAWLFVLQAILIGTILFAGNYYLWSGMSRVENGHRYDGLIKVNGIVLIICFLVWITPHSLILTASEQEMLGGSHHPVLGPLGIMPAKNIAVNLMLLGTFLSFQLYRRANKIITVSWAPFGNSLMISLYIVAIANIIFTGVYYGYFTNTVYKVGSSVPQVISTLIVIVAGIVIDTLMFKNADIKPSKWGNISNRSQYALFVLPVAFTWLMALMGYLRSSMKMHWHVYGVVKDNSVDNFIPTLGYAGNMITIITISFLLVILFLFWLSSLGQTRELVSDKSETKL